MNLFVYGVITYKGKDEGDYYIVLTILHYILYFTLLYYDIIWYYNIIKQLQTNNNW